MVWIVWYAIALHLWWALLFLGWGSDIAATPTTTLKTMGRDWVIAGCLMAVAGLAAGGITLGRGVWTMLPQQVVMVLSANDALQAIVGQSYADGVLRPFAFIAADQASVILAAIFHTCALIERIDL